MNESPFTLAALFFQCVKFIESRIHLSSQAKGDEEETLAWAEMFFSCL
jgi:hypothetical protein